MDREECPIRHSFCPRDRRCTMWDIDLESCRLMNALDSKRRIDEDGISVYVTGNLNTFEQN